mmetsp:Transcript_25369/g.58841  ORF Transcript_25369/g.58841 Transcript_25369/m.58841 type:complete len:252 (-) Transcript_25369:389-1144(-)
MVQKFPTSGRKFRVLLLHGFHLLQRGHAEYPAISGVLQAATYELHNFQHISAPKMIYPQSILLVQKTKAAHQCQGRAAFSCFGAVGDAVLKKERRGQVNVTCIHPELLVPGLILGSRSELQPPSATQSDPEMQQSRGAVSVPMHLFSPRGASLGFNGTEETTLRKFFDEHLEQTAPEYVIRLLRQKLLQSCRYLLPANFIHLAEGFDQRQHSRGRLRHGNHCILPWDKDLEGLAPTVDTVPVRLQHEGLSF